MNTFSFIKNESFGRKRRTSRVKGLLTAVCCVTVVVGFLGCLTDGDMRRRANAATHTTPCASIIVKDDKDPINWSSPKPLLPPLPPPQTRKMSEILATRTMRQLQNQHLYRHYTQCPTTTTSQSNTLDEETITLATQSSSDRVWLIHEICRRWTQGPIVYMVYFQDQARYDELAANLLKTTRNECPHVNLLYVINDDNALIPAGEYPVNLLRNLALEAVQTSHVLLNDADFLPSGDLADQIRLALAKRRQRRVMQEGVSSSAQQLDALVVPAFEAEFSNQTRQATFLQHADKHVMEWIPSNFDSLQSCIQERNCRVFRKQIAPTAHSTTRSSRWLDQQWNDKKENNDDIQSITCLKSGRYEPYLILPWCDGTQSPPQHIAPLFDERFRGYGKNKVQYFRHVLHLNYHFYVVPQGFLIHAPHNISSSKRVHVDKMDHDDRQSKETLFNTFVDELYRTLGYNVTLPDCVKRR